MGNIEGYNDVNKAKALHAHLQFPPNMDYTYYANANQQPYQFLGLPPTPSRTNVISGDEFSSVSPPVSIHARRTSPGQTDSGPGRLRTVPDIRCLQSLRCERCGATSNPAIPTPILRHNQQRQSRWGLRDAQFGPSSAQQQR
jgi:hypothetical protein